MSPAAQKALVPGPTRMMAARGMLPLPRPGELASVLYQLALEPDAATADAARATAAALPDKIVVGVLADAEVDPRVLDWLAPRCVQDRALHDALITAPAVADETIVALAAAGDARAVDLIAQNEHRLLRHPAILAAMYGNPRARMSTVDRAVELAVRNQVKVEGIAAWDELARVITSGGGGATADDDALFDQAMAGVAEVGDDASADPDAVPVGADGELVVEAAPTVDEKKVPINRMSVAAKIRLASVGNAFARNILIRDPSRLVAVAAIKSHGVSDSEAARHAGNPNLCDDVVRYIASRKEWTRLYSVKVSLIMNPKSPLPEVARLLPHLREKDLKNVAKSKGVPSAVTAQAKKLISQRTGGPGRNK
ncbi:MAG: hypothetical protein H6709_10985 [Kofleriaceae bacterium]|nr:hypothetical protein [Kofleriaceae bacterium]